MKIQRKQLREIEFLFHQSTKGVHLLFPDNKKLACILKNPIKEKIFFSSQNMNTIQEVFTGLVLQKGIKQKQRYLNHLAPEKFEILVKAYFHILDNTLSSKKMIH